MAAVVAYQDCDVFQLVYSKARVAVEVSRLSAMCLEAVVARFN